SGCSTGASDRGPITPTARRPTWCSAWARSRCWPGRSSVARSAADARSVTPMAQQDGDWAAEQRQRIEELIDEYRAALHDSLNDLTEDEARRRLVPSKTTLLGLVEHASFVE